LLAAEVSGGIEPLRGGGRLKLVGGFGAGRTEGLASSGIFAMGVNSSIPLRQTREAGVNVPARSAARSSSVVTERSMPCSSVNRHS
jgi:hypothetical protein